MKIFTKYLFYQVCKFHKYLLYIEWSGEYEISIFFEEQPINSSPFILKVLPNEDEDYRYQIFLKMEEEKRKKKEEEELLLKRQMMKQEIEIKIKTWSYGLSFRQLLNEIFKRYLKDEGFFQFD